MAAAGTVLGEAYAALSRGEADAAVEQFQAACSQERSGAALEGLARAHYVRTTTWTMTSPHRPVCLLSQIAGLITDACPSGDSDRVSVVEGSQSITLTIRSSTAMAVEGSGISANSRPTEVAATVNRWSDVTSVTAGARGRNTLGFAP